MKVTRADDQPSARTSRRARLLGTVLVIELLLLLAVMVPLLGSTGDSEPVDVTFFGWTFSMARPSLFFVLSLAGGAVGGTLHSVASLTAHVADEDLHAQWTLWYLANPFVGAALAGIFLFVLQAGLGGQTAVSSSTGLYGVAAFATLAGLFSRHALAKLKDIFDVAFASSRGKEADALPMQISRPPTVLALAPTTLEATGQDTPISVAGTGFTSGSEVELGGTRLRPMTLGPDSASVIVPGALLGHAATLPLRVRSGEGLWSNAADLEVRP